MFTGIITELGTVTALETLAEADAARLRLYAPDSITGLDHGGSIAVNGTCLTATDIHRSDGTVSVEVMGETLRRTGIGDLAPGERVNLERCVPVDGRLDGHVVQGHVDGVGTIIRVDTHGHWRQVRIALPTGLGRYVAEKGSITVDGVSLTVTAVSEPASGSGREPAGHQEWFEVGLIPATLTATTLGNRVAGDRVNLEVDVLAKYAARLHDYDRATGAGQDRS